MAAFLSCPLVPSTRSPVCVDSAMMKLPRDLSRHAGQRALRYAARQGRAQLRTFVYGAGGAFRSFRRRAGPHGLELLHAAGQGRGPSRNGWNRSGNGRGGGHSDDGTDDEDDFGVDPSWGAAPGVHVVMRGRCDEAYRTAVANLLAFAGNSIPAGSAGLAIMAGKADPSVPLVILLSWMGANNKSIAKYKAFYESIGYEVHVVMNGLRTAIFPPASKQQADHVARVIDVQHPNRPVFVHAFSIGTGIYGLFLHNLKHDLEKLEAVKNKVVGVIFDSGPAPIFPHDVAKGLHTVCPMISKAAWEVAARAFFFVTQARKSFEKGELALRAFQMPSPQLYFYSKDDKVIPNIHHAIEEFIEKNKQRGIEVYKTFWEKSIHATHLKVHPDEYLANLEQFIRHCMRVRSLPMPAVKVH